jgi:hypothetical protein
MSTYAKINSEDIVENVIICEDSIIGELNGIFIKVTDETNSPITGYLYNKEKNKFESPQPYPSWTLNANLIWESPAGPKPAGIARWDEENLEWDIIVPAE